ncbi:hypothetical protein SAMN02745148_03212 [Modicisalibacter ilicicola DSM 19980]|uniref:VOC domain-containing protein n=1 Tax=Modicisalibacter ilicicola DSM 19980 TaxID=1121942 RepID=A0A1M5DF43_9GAMM|nr:hypothetical protein [Halomonas ilicicola]SHF65535.1 hypothetical protein SAMN02745148_03212 [Halomonas ilicicola DSM 19980]
MQRLSLDKAVIRVRDIARMCRFCDEVLGLPLLLGTPASAIFELGTDARGHTQVVMLIASDLPEAPRHLMLEASAMEFAGTCPKLCRHGARLFDDRTRSAPDCGWRILSCTIPEGHRLQVVSIDPGRCLRPCS